MSSESMLEPKKVVLLIFSSKSTTPPSPAPAEKASSNKMEVSLSSESNKMLESIQKYGETLGSSKLAFFEMCRDVFEPSMLVTVAGSSNGQSSNPTPFDKALKRFRLIVRKRMIRGDSPYWSRETITATWNAAETQAMEIIRRLTQDMESGEAQKLKEDLATHLKLEQVWIEEVNKWKKVDYFETLRANSVTLFKEELIGYLGFDKAKLVYFEDREIQAIVKTLFLKTTHDFHGDIPPFEEDEVKKDESSLLGQQLAQVRNDVVKQNMMNKEISLQLANEALAQYKHNMKTFIDENTMTTTPAMQQVHDQTKKQCEMDNRLVENLGDLILRKLWTQKVDKAYKSFGKLWREQVQTKVAACRVELEEGCNKFLKNELQIVQKHLNVPIHDDDHFKEWYLRRFDRTIKSILEGSDEEGKHPNKTTGHGSNDNRNNNMTQLTPSEYKPTLASLRIFVGNKLLAFIPKNSSYPRVYKIRLPIKSEEHNQKSLTFIVREGEHATLEENNEIRKFSIWPIPASVEGAQLGDLGMTIDAFGRLFLEVKLGDPGYTFIANTLAFKMTGRLEQLQRKRKASNTDEGGLQEGHVTRKKIGDGLETVEMVDGNSTREG